WDGGIGIAVDGAGSVYTAGQFQDTVDFDPGPGTANLVSAGNNDVFVSKLDAVGNYAWARRMGGADLDTASAIALDGAGGVYTAGALQGTAASDPGPGTALLTSAGGQDVFVSKLDIGGNYAWVRRMGGAGHDYASAIALDGAGGVYTAGSFRGTADFDPGPGTA